jgi:hypothetical protein
MALAALTVLLAAAWPHAFAEAPIDLVGTWRLNYDRSESPVGGSGIDVTFPSEIVVTQSATQLSVTRRRHGRGVQRNLGRQRQRPPGEEDGDADGESQTASAAYDRGSGR